MQDCMPCMSTWLQVLAGGMWTPAPVRGQLWHRRLNSSSSTTLQSHIQLKTDLPAYSAGCMQDECLLLGSLGQSTLNRCLVASQ